MNKRLLVPFFVLATLLTGFVSCSDETEEEDEYANWEKRNDAFLDSIVSISSNPPSDETWETHLSYKLQSDEDTDLGITKNDYVYMKILKEGDEDGATPMSTDSVYTAYKGMLINEEEFDYSYSGDFDLAYTEANYVTLASAVITGWTTALLYMKEGERVMLYIPYKLAYGTDDYNTIPGYSLLIFDLYLGKVVHPEGPDDRSLVEGEILEEEEE